MKNLIGVAILLSASVSHGQSCNHSHDEEALFGLTAHTNSAFGGGNDGDFRHALHGHDPERGLRLQGLELGLFSNLASNLRGFANVTIYEDDGKVETEWEEGYVKLHSLPYGFEARAGRFFGKVGTQNNVHLHDWEFVDSNLLTPVFLGQDGLIINGGELSWHYIHEFGVVGLNVAAGQVEGHGHDHEGGGLENEGVFEGSVLVVRPTVHQFVNNIHQHFVGLSTVFGENGYGRDGYFIGADYNYSFGEKFSLTAELGMRKVEWVHEGDASLQGDAEQYSLRLSSKYRLNEHWVLGARAEWLEGMRDGPLNVGGMTEYGVDIPEMKRFSLALTRSLIFGQNYTGKVRLQYNLDDRSGSQEHSIWLQFGAGGSWSF